MKTVHIFFNGDEVAGIPDNCPWEQFKDHDAIRSFLQTCESWKSAGWNVRRFSTAYSAPIFTGEDGKGTGEIFKSFSWYPETRWRFVRDFWAHVRGFPGFHWFATMDSFNRCFTPHMADAAEKHFGEKGCVNLQVDHFSMSTVGVTSEWLFKAIRILCDYDSGRLPRLCRDYVSDETILREYSEYLTLPAQYFPISTHGVECPELIHFARSTLKRAYQSIPSNA